MFETWLFSVFAFEREQKLLYKFAYLGRVLALMMLLYISVLMGLPSGHKDWTPEPLIKQMIVEATGDREKAKQTIIINLAFEERDNAKGEPGSLIMDEEKILLQ